MTSPLAAVSRYLSQTKFQPDYPIVVVIASYRCIQVDSPYGRPVEPNWLKVVLIKSAINYTKFITLLRLVCLKPITPCLVLGWGFRGRRNEWRYFQFCKIQYGGAAAILENSNGDISVADHPIYSVFGSSMGFSGWRIEWR